VTEPAPSAFIEYTIPDSEKLAAEDLADRWLTLAVERNLSPLTILMALAQVHEAIAAKAKSFAGAPEEESDELLLRLIRLLRSAGQA
jgi:hypothetical protein